MKRMICTCLVVLSGFFFIAAAQNEPVDPVLSKENIEHFDIDVASQRYFDMLTPEQKARSDAYFEGGYWIMLGGFLMQLAIAWIFLSLGLSAWINRITSKAKRINIRNLIYILFYLFFAFLMAFPFSVYTGFFREHRYGLSNMTFPLWLSEEMISLSLILVFGSLLIMVLYIVMRKTIGQWWIWGSVVSIVFMIFLFFISPVFISPLFNDYKPLEEGAIKEDILSMARANGVPVDNVYQFDASKQSTRISANVSGIGRTIRISLNDNLLNRCTPAEVISVMAHELGHYVLNHIYKLVIYFSLVLIIGFAFVNFFMKKLITRFSAKWGINNISDINSLPLFVVVFSFYILIATPVINNISRITEIEADLFELNAAREPDASASIAMKLSEYRKINPGRLEEIIFYDHPSGKIRVMMAMTWKVENLKKKAY